MPSPCQRHLHRNHHVPGSCCRKSTKHCKQLSHKVNSHLPPPAQLESAGSMPGDLPAYMGRALPGTEVLQGLSQAVAGVVQAALASGRVQELPPLLRVLAEGVVQEKLSQLKVGVQVWRLPASADGMLGLYARGWWVVGGNGGPAWGHQLHPRQSILLLIRSMPACRQGVLALASWRNT